MQPMGNKIHTLIAPFKTIIQMSVDQNKFCFPKGIVDTYYMCYYADGKRKNI